MACVALLPTCPLAQPMQRYLPELVTKIEPILEKHVDFGRRNFPSE